MRRLALLLFLVAAGAAAPSASAHALLESTSPARGSTSAQEPRAVVFTFDEPVETAFGALRVFDARAARVDDDRVTHPGGAGKSVAVGLKPGLPRGTYTATYRVISADGHPVSGGLVFSVGAPGAGPAASVATLLDASTTGWETRAAQAGARGVQYAAIAVAGGLLVFLAACWRPALQQVAGAEGRWRAGSAALAARSVRVGLLAAAAGFAGAATALVTEAATAGGISFWSALDPSVLREVAGTRTGEVLVLQLLAWLALAGALLVLAPRRAIALQPAALGADGQAVAAAGRVPLAGLAVPIALLVVSPALEGHQITRKPVWANLGLDLFHVASVTAWVGGIAALLFVVPAATSRLEPAERTRLLAALLTRFSPIALCCVVVIAATGTVAAILELRALGDLVHSGYGRTLLVKASMLLVLIALGAVNRRRAVPRLAALAAGAGAAPGAAGRLLRRTLRAEAVTLAVALGATGLLVGSSPPGAAAAGPFSDRVPLGRLELEVTVDPARTGPNELHVYLFDKATGAPSTVTKELRITATQLQARIGPLPVRLRPSGPGHYTADTLSLQPGGTWRLSVEARVSNFDQYETKLEVPIR